MSRKKASRIGEGPLSSPNQMLSKIQVAQIRALSASNHSMRRISKMTGISRNTVSKYLKGAEHVARHRSIQTQWLEDNRERVREEFFNGGCNCAVVQRNLKESGIKVGLRQLQRLSEPFRQEQKAIQKYCRRYETSPGDHSQIDFCEKTVVVAGEAVKIHVFVAVLGFSRRIFR